MRTFTPEKLIKYKICWRFPQRNTPQKAPVANLPNLNEILRYNKRHRKRSEN